ncbi:MAG: lysophospholipid acyltransferase family protein [Gemmatimonadales bacterium]
MRIVEPGPAVPRRGGPVRRRLGRLILRGLGWGVEGGLPDLPRFVVIAAPHSSAWDFPIGIAVVFALRLDVRFIGKAELFRGPLGVLMRWLGGIPVDRSRPQGVVDDVVARFRTEDRLVLAIAPEGTRKPVTRWKTGFHRIALEAGVPIVPGVFDNGRRAIRFLPPFTPTGDVDADISALRALYAGVQRRD